MKRLRANTLKDHCNFLLHFGLTAGVAAGAFVTLGFPPIISALAIGGTAAIHLALRPRVKRAFEQAIHEEKSNGLGVQHIDAERLTKDLFLRRRLNLEDYVVHKPSILPKVERWVGDFAYRLGLKKIPHVAIMERSNPRLFESAGERDPLKDSIRTFLRDKFNQTANAFAFRHSNGNIVLNEPIVENLPPQQLKGVVGHEIGHLAAGHNNKQQLMGILATPAKILTTLNLAVSAYSSFRTAGLFFLANAAGGFAAGIAGKLLGWSPENPRDKQKIKNLSSIFTAASVAGAGLMAGAPDLAIASGLSYATNTALNLISKRYSRCAEFQADRIAAELTGDPRGMARGLHAVRDMHYKHAGLPLPDDNPGFVKRAFDRFSDLMKTHPNVDRRCERLGRMDQRVEYIFA